MAEDLFGFNSQSGFDNHVFTYGHFIFAALAVLALVLLLVLFAKKKERSKKIVLVASLISFIVLEVVKIIYRSVMLTKLGLPVNFWSVVDFNFTTLMIWFIIPTLGVSLFFNKYRLWNKFVYAFIFSVGSLAGLFFFIFPLSLKVGYGFFHILNVTTILSNFVLFFLSVYVGITYFLEVSVKQFWLIIVSMIIAIGLVFAIYYASGEVSSVMFIAGCEYLERIGVSLKAPLHMFIIGGMFFVMQILFYIPMQIVNDVRMKKIGK